jgi:hypothetical protein
MARVAARDAIDVPTCRVCAILSIMDSRWFMLEQIYK